MHRPPGGVGRLPTNTGLGERGKWIVASREGPWGEITPRLLIGTCPMKAADL